MISTAYQISEAKKEQTKMFECWRVSENEKRFDVEYAHAHTCNLNMK